MKRFTLLVLMAVMVAGGVSAQQQFAKTGVINLTRVTQFYKDARATGLDDLRAAIQKDIDKMKADIVALNDQRNDAVKKGDQAKVQSLDGDIQSKKDALTAYGKQKQDELNAAADALKNDTTFQKLLAQEIEQAAISKGFALVLNSNNPAVLWYGTDADITDDVLARLQVDLGH
jgi:Skp family chaperone for outer membrane proteins